MDSTTSYQSARREAISREYQFLPQRGATEHQARVVLDGNGKIKQVSKAARRLLGYYSSQYPERCFFSLVREQHRTRIMWDLSEMVGRRRQRAEWLVQMKTAHGTWRWFHVQAYNRLHHSSRSGIMLELTPCGATERP